jgi:hypothetical protein
MELGLGIDVAGSDQLQSPLRLQAYLMSITEPDGREILAYHWHPRGRSPTTFPHVHVTSRTPAIPIGPGESVAIADMHLPTSQVGLADVVRFLIVEFGIDPRRDDWEAVLASSS